MIIVEKNNRIKYCSSDSVNVVVDSEKNKVCHWHHDKLGNAGV